MFEYVDDKLGKVKLINVTEARANFAKLLSDSDTYYVITKNNKPQRVVISYDEFREIKEFTQQLAKGSQELGAVRPAPPKKKAAPKTSRVPGLLAKQAELSGSKEYLEQEEPESAAQVAEELQEVVDRQEPNLGAEIMQSSSGDYFQTGDEDLVLPEPDDVLSELEDEDSDAILEEIRETLNLEDGVALDEDEHIPVEEPVQEESTSNFLSDDEEIEDPTAGMSTEEKAYYQKYRKLYERVEEPEPEPAEQESEVELIVDSLPNLDETPPEPEPQVVSQVVEEAAAEPEPAPRPEPQPEPSIEVLQENLNEGDEDLPSLQELLQELEPEVPEATDKNLSDTDIDDIVKRIRYEE